MSMGLRASGPPSGVSLLLSGSCSAAEVHRVLLGMVWFIREHLPHCPLAEGSKSSFLLGKIGGMTDQAMPHLALHTACAYYIGVPLDTDMQGRGS